MIAKHWVAVRELRSKLGLRDDCVWVLSTQRLLYHRNSNNKYIIVSSAWKLAKFLDIQVHVVLVVGLLFNLSILTKYIVIIIFS